MGGAAWATRRNRVVLLGAGDLYIFYHVARQSRGSTSAQPQHYGVSRGILADYARL